MSSGFHHLIAVDRIGERPQTLRMAANEQQRDSLARRFGLEAVDSLTADLTLERDGSAIRTRGQVLADVVQTCVVSAEPVPAHIDETIDLWFETDPARVPADDAEVTADMADILPVDNGRIDVAEAVAQTLLLALDPYPRADAETLAAARRHLLSEEEAEEADAAAREEARVAANPFSRLRQQ